ncbi:MAG: cupin domain-containing protein [Pseudomonadales bacterium]
MNGSASNRIATALGSLPRADFLRDYWQQKPLLVRASLADYESPISADELAGLACEPEIESRIIQQSANTQHWTLEHGPFVEQRFRELPERDWTLLIQAIELWVPEIRKLRQRFDFLPSWRFEDIMASFAMPGGSVGPHFDQYDVFLVQVEGQRLWQIGEPCEPQTAPLINSDLKILADFAATEQWLLNPGDVLYLPPLISHWGLAKSPCVTFSVGFRAPSVADMLGDLATELLSQDHQAYYSDPPLTPEMATEAIHPAFITQAKALLHNALEDDALLEDWFARYMTGPKYPGREAITGELRQASVNGRVYRNGEPQDSS